ncbi:hypothetical protein GQ55_1G329500 [Panicum hallii var. hallii]|uniref:Uncharacterized protein n=1 Tax=Panicum hallii var. hallii TaxID=1504633 RepID=A0A2T7FA22_9POAL|nr:hypothetical protein GQ55_1G329500 [Panicum hallii var. hallii]
MSHDTDESETVWRGSGAGGRTGETGEEDDDWRTSRDGCHECTPCHPGWSLAKSELYDSYLFTALNFSKVSVYIKFRTCIYNCKFTRMYANVCIYISVRNYD